MRTFWQWLAQYNLFETTEDILSRVVPHEEGVIGSFRQLVLDRLGDLGVLVLDLRLAGGETRSLVDCPAVGSPGRREVERVLRRIKNLAQEHAGSVGGDWDLLRRIEVAMEEEEAAFGNRPRQS